MKKGISKLLVTALTCTMVSGLCFNVPVLAETELGGVDNESASIVSEQNVSETEGVTTAEQNVQETESVTSEAPLAETKAAEPEQNFEKTFYEAVEKFGPASYDYLGDEGNGVTGKMGLFRAAFEEGIGIPAKDSDKAVEYVEPIKLTGGEAITAYNEAVACYEAVKAAYENCPEDVRSKKNDDGLSIADVYGDIQNDYAALEAHFVNQAIVDYYAAWCNGYGDIRTFIGASGEYLGRHDPDNGVDRNGLLDDYNDAVAAGKDNETILQCYQKAVEGRTVMINAYSAFREKSDAVLDAKNAISESDMLSELCIEVEGSFRRIWSNVDSGEILYSNIPQVPALSYGNAPKTTINETIEEVADKIDLTTEEQEAIGTGDAIIAMTVEDVEPTGTEQALIEEKIEEDEDLRGYSVGLNLNIEISLDIIKDNFSRKITEMRNPVNISVTVPDDLLNKDNTKNRTYAVLRIHEGTATVIEGEFKDGQFTFASDRFSTYSLIYKDELISGGEEENEEEEDSGSQDTSSAGTSSGSNGGTSPKTGDNTPVGLLFALMIASAAGLVFLWKKNSQGELI